MKSATKARHTPAPWKVALGDNGIHNDGSTSARVIVSHDKGAFRCVAMAYHGDHDRDANAEFIVRAVNSHDALVAALDEALTFMLDSSEEGGGLYAEARIKDARTALALAHGEQP